jgi:hypothetical protein
MSAKDSADGIHVRRVAIFASLAYDLSSVNLRHFEQAPMACQSTDRKGVTGGIGSLEELHDTLKAAVRAAGIGVLWK